MDARAASDIIRTQFLHRQPGTDVAHTARAGEPQAWVPNAAPWSLYLALPRPHLSLVLLHILLLPLLGYRVSLDSDNASCLAQDV